MKDQSKPDEMSNNPGNRRNIKIGKGNYNEYIGGDYIEQVVIQNSESTKTLNQPSNLKKTGAANFVGRSEKLKELHQLLQQSEQVSICAIAGMGGIGKTELALQYALAYKEDYPGSLCWFSVRGENLCTQIIEFARSSLKIFPPDQLETDLAKLDYCWQNWRSEASLIILDDVPNYGQFYRNQIAPYLPPATSNIKLLITSRERPGTNIPRLDLDVLTEAKALELLESFIGKSRIEAEPELAKELCQWLGYLPLGLELVGRYIDLDDNLTIERTLKRLKRKKLEAPALLDPEQADMNAQLGVAAAFDLSWDVLSPEAQELGCYLSLFNSEPFKWLWVEAAWIESEDEDEQEDVIEELEILRNKQLTQRNLLKLVPGGNAYQLHSLIAQYLRAKLEEREQVTELKQKFCGVMNQVAQQIPQTPTLEEIQAFTITIPHLTFVAHELTKYIDDEDLIWSYQSLGRFYQGQGLYNQGSVWLEQCLNVCRERFGEEHSDVATSLNNLAGLYESQGRYRDAEPLYIQALKLNKQFWGEQHSSVAINLNNLGLLYKYLGKYEKAESFLFRALELYQQLPGEQQHPYLAKNINNLASLYESQGKYEKAESFYLQALDLKKQLLGEEDPSVATSLSNLGLFYSNQERYSEAESLMLHSLGLYQKLLGEQHLSVATNFNNLALLYLKLERYEQAEVFINKALELYKLLLGEQHPDVARSLNNLATLYSYQERYGEAEPFYLQALELRKQLLGEQHPDVAESLHNLAEFYRVQGKYEDAEPLYLQALSISSTALGENHPHTKIFQKNLNSLRAKWTSPQINADKHR